MSSMPYDDLSREELIKELNYYSLLHSKSTLRSRFIRNKLGICEIQIDENGYLRFERNVRNVLGLFSGKTKLKDFFVETDQSNSYFNFIDTLKKRMWAASKKADGESWETVKLGSDEKHPFKDWLRLGAADWEISGGSIQSNPSGGEKNYYLTSPVELIGPNDDFRITYKAKSSQAPCDLSLSVAGSLFGEENSKGGQVPEDQGYCFAFGAFLNRETHLQIRGNNPVASAGNCFIKPEVLHHCEVERVGGILRMRIDGELVINYCDPFPILGKGHGYISLYTYAPNHCFSDVVVQRRPTCLDGEFQKELNDFNRLVLELKRRRNHFVEVEYYEDVFLFHDVTQVVKAHFETAELVRKQQIRENSVEKIEIVGRLAAGTAHNFNNSLMIIQGLTELLGLKLGPDDPSADFIKKILHQCKNSARLVGQLLDFSSQRMLVLMPIEINKIVNNVITVVKNTFNPNIKVESELKEEALVIKGDRAHLETAILNMAINARDAMPSGGTLSFSTSVVTLEKKYFIQNHYQGEPGSYVCLEVVDSGEGMTDETKEKVFQPFFTTKAEGKGTGLGLSSVYGTIKGHSGFINLVSDVGVGTTFEIYLPLEDIEAEPIIEHLLKPKNVSSKEKTILVLDDEGTIGNILELALADAGYAIKVFHNSKNAVKYYKEHSHEIDLSLLDLIMPDLNGVECFNEFRKINNEAHCIFMSGHQGEQDDSKQLVQREGVFAFVKKPFDLENMTTIVDSFFEN